MSKSRALSNGEFGAIFASRKCSREQAHLVIRNSSKISCGGSNGNLCSRSEGSGESAHVHRLAWAFVTVSESHVHARLAVWVCHLCEQRIKALVNIHKAAQVHLSLLLLDNLISTKLSCWPGMRFRCYIWLQRCSGESAHSHRLNWAFVTVPKFYALAQMTTYVLFIRAAKALVSLHL